MGRHKDKSVKQELPFWVQFIIDAMSKRIVQLEEENKQLKKLKS